MTGALVLAGGRNRRMGGRPKALLELGGMRFLDRLALSLDAFEEKLLSTDDPALAAGTPFRQVADRIPGKGPLSGLHAALTAAESGALVVTACDIPFFSAALAHWLASERERLGVDALGIEDRRGRAHPLCGCYSKACLPALERALRSDRLRVMALFSEVDGIFLPLAETPFPDVLLTNVNTPAELEVLTPASRHI